MKIPFPFSPTHRLSSFKGYPYEMFNFLCAQLPFSELYVHTCSTHTSQGSSCGGFVRFIFVAHKWDDMIHSVLKFILFPLLFIVLFHVWAQLISSSVILMAMWESMWVPPNPLQCYSKCPVGHHYAHILLWIVRSGNC